MFLSAEKLLAGAPPVECAEPAKAAKQQYLMGLARTLTGNEQPLKLCDLDPFEQRVSRADHRPRGLCQAMDSLKEI